MTVGPWLCACGQPGVRNVGTEGFCATHLAQLYGTFNPTVFKLAGVGLPGTISDPTLLTCCACAATWHGLAGEPCWWCQAALWRMLIWQEELVLTPPDVDPADTRAQQRLEAWAERLETAVRSGLVERNQAATALQREVARVGA